MPVCALCEGNIVLVCALCEGDIVHVSIVSE